MRRAVFNRARFWWTILKRSVWPLIAISLTVLGNIFAIRDEFLPPRLAEKLKTPAFLPDLPWYWWTIATLLLIVGAILEESYRLLGTTGPAPLIDHDHSFLFLDPPRRELWKAQIRFARGGDKLKIRLDYSSHSGGLGEGFWSEPRHLLLRQQNTFAKGQDITIDLMALDDSEPRRFWRWTAENDGQPLVSPTMHHCRLAFVVDDRVADDFNFIVVMANDNSDGLLLLGENHFSFASEWRRHDGRYQ
jgi:hypothetical protein